MLSNTNRTITLVKDLIFQEKYKLTHSQTDLMAYLANVPHWAIKVNDYFIISTSKIISDLPNMGIKTIEASLKVLRDFNLIKSEVQEVKEWNGNPRIRGMQLTEKGKEYNAKLFLPNQDKKVKDLEEENKKLKKIVEDLQGSNNNSDSKPDSKFNKKSEEEKKVDRMILDSPKKEEIEIFVEKLTKRFGRNNKYICNGVPNWDKETIFFINSYNKLSIITPTDKIIQLKNPFEINKFWEWLFSHSNRIGDKINFKEAPTFKELENRYLNQIINTKKGKDKIKQLIQTKDGIEIISQDSNGKVETIISPKTGEKIILTTRQWQNLLFQMLV